MINKDKISQVIDLENGVHFSYNISLKGYVFTKNDSFMVFELKNIEDVMVCHIKYIYFNSKKDLKTIFTYGCNFWMGNKVEFIFYKELEKENSPILFLEKLMFDINEIKNYKWKYLFENKNNSNKVYYITR